MVTIIIRNDRFRIFMTDNINEQPIEFVSNSESKYVMGFTSRNSRRVRIWKTGRNIPLRSNGITNNGRQCRVRCTLQQYLYNRQEGINCKKTESGG